MAKKKADSKKPAKSDGARTNLHGGIVNEADASSGELHYAERMFPAPFDHGIAQADRAVTNVKHGTRAHLEGG
ncbi:MAG: hypothetical protein NT081_05965, partial [Actinobacteria bacterium]|nr:hypothetical protein [Actinomycetota bacterium]